MAIGQLYALPFYGQQYSVASNSDANSQKKENDELSKELAQLDNDAKAAQEAYLKRMELVQLKAKNNEIVENLKTQEEDAEKAYRQFLKTKNSKGAGRVDTGESGFMRWLSNAGTAIVNLGKSIIGFDKDGNWDPVKCITNIGITALAIGATFIPYVGPVIGYGLLAAGVIGGVVGVANGISDLNEAEKSGDQAKIDEAQQDICSNAFIGITSALGLRGIGKAFRTSSATAESASSAASRTSMGGKCVESVSNFGRDITVNAFKATKHSAVSGTTPSLARFTSWEKQFAAKNKAMLETYTQRIAQLEKQILAETNAGKRALLLEQKQMLEANFAEYSRIGSSIKSKADFDKLAQDNMAKFNQEYIQSYPEATGILDESGNVMRYRDINGMLVKEQDFLLFQQRVMRQQKALEKELQQLIKTKENMMRAFARRPKKHRAALDEYISTSGTERSLLKPSSFLKSKEALAIGGKNPKLSSYLLGLALTSPASNVPKFSGAWVDPIHTGSMLYSVELTPEETQTQIETMQTAINGISALREKMEKAETVEDFNEALKEYEQLVAAANGEQTTTSETPAAN